MADAIAKFDNLVARSEFVFLVYYRGHWCPFDASYLKQLQSLTASIIAANGTPITVTAEISTKQPEMQAVSGYTGETIIDTKNELARELKRRGLVDVAISEKKGYENGMAQPAVLVIKNDKTVLYHWAISPSMMNIGGAKDRPLLNQIWANTEAQLRGGQPVYEKFSKLGIMEVLKEKVFG